MRLAWLLALVAACGPSSPPGGACKDTMIAGDLVITEVFADFRAPSGGTGTDTGKEWFEIYNNADHPLDLEGLTIVHSRPDGSRPMEHKMTGVTIAPGQYFTLGNATPDLVPPYVDYGYSADLGELYNTDGGKLALKCGDQEIDSAVYDGVKAGHSRELTDAQPPDYTLNDDLMQWCQGDATEFEAGNFGTPGSENDCTPVVMGQCSDGGTMRDVVPPGVGDLVITEVMPSPAKVSDTVGEWFEVKALKDVDLNGIGLDRAGDSSNPNVVTSPDCLRLTAGSYALFAKSNDMTANGGLPAGSVLGTFTFSMVSGSSTAPGDVQIVSQGNVIDAVTWTSSRSGKALQLDPDFTDAVSNDMASNFCDATQPYGLGDLGTPAADNGQCTMLPPPGMCDDNGTLRAIVPPPMGALVITEVMPHPVLDNSGPAEWFEITNAGTTAFDLNGLGLDRAGDTRKPDVISGSACISLAPAAFALFARGADPATNGGLPAVDATFGLSMVDSGGNVQVVDPASCAATSPYDCTTIYDNAVWTTTASGVSKQLPPGMYTTTANDNAANYCPGVAAYGADGNKGTPKAENACM
jgi:hypothetical protein